MKEYSVALAVFGRPDSFDPHHDPIVRVQARRLRSRLAEFYCTQGLNDPIEIRLPKGKYAPIFERRPFQTATGSTGVGAARKSIAVVRFVNLADNKETERFNGGLAEELIAAFKTCKALKVFAWQSGMPSPGSDLRSLARQLRIDALLSGTVSASPANIRVMAHLTGFADGYLFWSGEYRRRVPARRNIQRQIAREIALEVSARLREPEQECSDSYSASAQVSRTQRM